MSQAQPLWLASRSPRRKQMLEELAVDLRIQPPDIDDAKLQPGAVAPEIWVLALAYLKARCVAEILLQQGSSQGTVLGADTVCVTQSGKILGQPRDVQDAQSMLRLLSNAVHRTITGVCLLDLGSLRRSFIVDAARVIVGPIEHGQIESYLSSNEWRGKAGAYNLSERIQAGWPIQCVGDPATVMGLPLRRLMPILEQLRSQTRT